MSVYMIASYNIDDPAAHDHYVAAADPLLEKHGGRLLAADIEAVTMEGSEHDLHVIVEFENEEAAVAFYNDPEYAIVKKIRHNATSGGHLTLLQPVEIPTT